MKIRIKNNSYSDYGILKDTIWPVLVVYHNKEDGNILYLVDVPLGAAYHRSRVQNYQIVSPLYNKTRHLNGGYGWINKLEVDIRGDMKSNQDCVWLLKRGKQS